VISDLPRVSIVTPSFNQAEFLEETMLSVLGQDYPEIEYIVMDGGSTDGSVDIIRKHEDRLAVWSSQRDTGQASAINRGFARATGTIFAWLNSDDLLAPSAVRIAVDALRRFPSVGVIFGDRLHIDARGNVIGINRMPAYYASMLRRNITWPQETVFFRRSVFEEVGGVDETLRFSLDFDLWARMAKVTQVRHVPAFLGSFREHGESKSVAFHKNDNRDADRYLAEHEQVYRKHFGRSLPGRRRMKWNRLLHKARLGFERCGRAHQREMAHLREIRAQDFPATPSLALT
jgi:glycosyltransferase involved in cell wall biosynthesis